MSNSNGELSKEFLALLVSKCLYRENHYGAGIPRELEEEICNVAKHELPSGLRVYGVRTTENPRFYRDVVISGEELDHHFEWEEPCYGADAKILKPCIILAHTNSQDRPDSVICQVGYKKGSNFYTVSNKKSSDGTGTIQYLRDRGYINREIKLDSEELSGESGISDIIGETIRAIQDFKKIPDDLRAVFINQLESLRAKIEIEKGMQDIPVTRILMDKFIQDLESQDELVFEGNEESRVQGQVADKIYVIDGQKYRVSCKMDDRKKHIPELVNGKLSDETNLKIVMYCKDSNGEYKREKCRIQMYYNEDGERIHFTEVEGFDECKKYRVDSKGTFMVSDKRVYHIVVPDRSELQLNPREFELATLDTATPDQIRQVYNRLRDIVRYQVGNGVEVVTDEYGYIQEKVGMESIRLTGEDFENTVPDTRIAAGAVAILENGQVKNNEENEVGEVK